MNRSRARATYGTLAGTLGPPAIGSNDDDVQPAPRPAAGTPDLGFVVIGRNEGARLERCLSSLLAHDAPAVYVDSGSHDDSVALAQRFGLDVVELDMRIPSTAARARNAGLQWLRRHHPELAFVHFIDGDCELVPGWLDKARTAILAEPELAGVCGRRRERHPDASVYNRLCDVEWNTPVGPAETCGGDALYRIAALVAVDGFSPDMIAGEEPDLGHRLRLRGWSLRRIEGDMTLHDAAMTRFAQWWQRNRRSGYATAEALSRRGRRNPRLWRAVMSNVVWSLPVAWPLWPLLWLKVCLRGGPLLATFITLGKIPHLQGQVDFWRSRKRLIEYK